MESRTVTIVDRIQAYKLAFFNIELVKFKFTRFNGAESATLQHLVFNRGNSVGMLVHDTVADDIFLVEQMRIATIAAGDGWLLEIPAGKVDDHETPEEAAARELHEEIGLQATNFTKIASIFSSPGACSEQIHIYYCPCSDTANLSLFGGLEAEGEDIKVHRIPRQEALSKMNQGELSDAKTMIALQWLDAKART